MAAKTLGKLLVVLQLLGMASSVYALRFAPPASAVMLLPVIPGAIMGLITLYYNRVGNFGIHPEPLKGTQLITLGPYRWIRHPMYLSVILFLLGLALYAQHWIGFAGLMLAAIAVIWKSFLEEEYLESRFAGYKDYKSKTKRIIPFLY